VTLHRAREAIDRAVELVESALNVPNGIVSSGGDAYERKAIALSFDDGPSPANTPRILDLLRASGARATFFVVGQEVTGHEEIVGRIAAEGHELGNHTYSHPHTIGLRRPGLREELEKTNEALTRIDGVPPIRLVRPPYGKDRRRTDSVGRELGMRTVLWSVDSADSGSAIDSANAVAENVIANARPGSIVLLHDGGNTRPATIGGCERLVPALVERGFELVTVSELLGAATAPVSAT
jgi:peptidoglycan/xylan/chitin deacetylase (PgdA/CDA1 family)